MPKSGRMAPIARASHRRGVAIPLFALTVPSARPAHRHAYRQSKLNVLGVKVRRFNEHLNAFAHLTVPPRWTGLDQKSRHEAEIPRSRLDASPQLLSYGVLLRLILEIAKGIANLFTCFDNPFVVIRMPDNRHRMIRRIVSSLVVFAGLALPQLSATKSWKDFVV